MSFIPVKDMVKDSTVSLAGSTLIIPSVSIGNIPQLSVDLLINNLDFSKVGSLSDKYVYPFASPLDSESQLGISGPIEVYHSPKHNLTVVQQRSPIIPGFIAKHVDEVVLPFIVKNSFSKVLVLDSADAGLEETGHGRIDLETSADILNQSLESLKLTSEVDHRRSSFVRQVVSGAHSDVDISVLITHVYEGDNFKDGEELATRTSELLKISAPRWTRPFSWHGAYGDKAVPISTEEGLFG